MKRVYLDHNATTPVHPEVLEAMLPYYKERFGNASSVHSYGREAREAIDEAREQVAELIGADPREIVFTSGGTESENFAIKGVAFLNRGKGNHIITSAIEHHAVLNTCKYLEKKGFEVTYLRVDEHGVVDLNQLVDSITDKTILITIMHANNEIGTIQPLEEIGRIAKEKGIPLHTDAVQTVGKIPVNVDELQVDLLSLSGHKIYGPKGVGALYVRRGMRLEKLIHGGHHERNRRAGTENVPGIVGLGKAAQLALKNMDREREHLWKLSERLKEGIVKRVKFVRQNGHPQNRIPNTVNLSFEFVEGESIVLGLDMHGICVSTGSACTSGSLEPSHVLMALNVPPELAHGSVRFSLGSGNTEEEIDYTIEKVAEVVERLRMMSPLYADAVRKRG
ncbi:TPA: cysteine desulfurase NifS [Candidatus Poribacteria bacterium]|nr:cysteine desulfurase NifS [Candidatus Poribacteria bacterium]